MSRNQIKHTDREHEFLRLVHQTYLTKFIGGNCKFLVKRSTDTYKNKTITTMRLFNRSDFRMYIGKLCLLHITKEKVSS